MSTQIRRRTVYLATVAAMIAMVGGWALAVTTTTAGPAQNTNITTSAPAGFTVASVGSTQAVLVSSTIAAYTGAGTQTVGTAGLSGSTITIATCAAGPCVANYHAVNGNAVTTGDYAEQIVLSVTQPATGGTASGFDAQLEVTINAVTLEFGNTYFSTGVSSAGTAQTVNVYVFVDLGVTSAPVVNTISIQLNACLSASNCP